MELFPIVFSFIYFPDLLVDLYISYPEASLTDFHVKSILLYEDFLAVATGFDKAVFALITSE